MKNINQLIRHLEKGVRKLKKEKEDTKATAERIKVIDTLLKERHETLSLLNQIEINNRYL